ncbi:kinase-like protein, partial [Hyaloscypha variabilis F]
MFSDSEVDIITRSLGQAQASGRHQSPKSLEYVKTLGRGGFGRVDEVSCKDLQQNFALKIIRRSVGGANSSSEFSIFKNEVEILKSLVHPHIVQFAGSHTFRNSFSILMHPVVDGNLAAFLRDVDLDAHRVPLETFNSMTPLYRLWTLMRCLASAVSYMHSINIVHGDLKPENVLIDGDQIFLTDFGSAKKLSNGKQSLETTYTLSPEFSAPETIESGNKDKPGDIWSFGCILVLVAT